MNRDSINCYSYFNELHQRFRLYARMILFKINQNYGSQYQKIIASYTKEFEFLLIKELQQNEIFCSIANPSIRNAVCTEIAEQFKLCLDDYDIQKIHLFINDMIIASLAYHEL